MTTAEVENRAALNGIYKKTTTPKVIVCIPAYNEEASIAGVIANAQPYANHVIVCDDGSKDKTAEVARKMGAEVFSNPVNMGKGFSLNMLFDYAKDIGADIVVTIDADGQHDPNEIPRLLEPILENRADIVVGSRYMKGSWTDAPRYRRLGLRIMNSLVPSGDFGVKDTQSGFRAFSARALKVLTWCESNGFGIEAEQLRKALRHKMRIVEVPVSIKYKGVVKTSKRNPISHGLEIAATALKLVVEDYPLLILGIPGMIMFLVGMGLGVNLLLIFNETRHFSIPLVALAASFLFGGVVLAVTSIILYAISKIGEKIERK
ncbi:MAG: glycosyltransferase family 2 protein [Candidatus Methanosuratincola petrocarbonis]